MTWTPPPVQMPMQNEQGVLTPAWKDWFIRLKASGGNGVVGADGKDGKNGPPGAKGADSADRYQVLTYASTLTWDSNLGRFASVTLEGDTVLAIPANATPGTYVLIIYTNGTNRTLNFSSAYKFPHRSTATLSITNTTDILTFVYDGTHMYGVIQKSFI